MVRVHNIYRLNIHLSSAVFNETVSQLTRISAFAGLDAFWSWIQVVRTRFKVMFWGVMFAEVVQSIKEQKSTLPWREWIWLATRVLSIIRTSDYALNVPERPCLVGVPSIASKTTRTATTKKISGRQDGL